VPGRGNQPWGRFVTRVPKPDPARRFGPAFALIYFRLKIVAIEHVYMLSNNRCCVKLLFNYFCVIQIGCIMCDYKALRRKLNLDLRTV